MNLLSDGRGHVPSNVKNFVNFYIEFLKFYNILKLYVVFMKNQCKLNQVFFYKIHTPFNVNK